MILLMSSIYRAYYWLRTKPWIKSSFKINRKKNPHKGSLIHRSTSKSHITHHISKTTQERFIIIIQLCWVRNKRPSAENKQKKKTAWPHTMQKKNTKKKIWHFCLTHPQLLCLHKSCAQSSIPSIACHHHNFFPHKLLKKKHLSINHRRFDPYFVCCVWLRLAATIATIIQSVPGVSTNTHNLRP